MSIENKEVKTPSNLVERYTQEKPEKSPLHLAIDKLKSPKSIQQFFEGYKTWMSRDNEKEKIEQTEDELHEEAMFNVRYSLEYYDEETKKLWEKALEKEVEKKNL